ncbi:MAG: S1C family serine protease, partial [Aureliella sp.]
MLLLFRNAHGGVWLALAIGVGIGIVFSQSWSQPTTLAQFGNILPNNAAPNNPVLNSQAPGAESGVSSRRASAPAPNAPVLNGQLPNGPVLNAAQAEPADVFLTPEEQVNTRVYETCNHCVVHISTKARRVESFLTVSVTKGSGSGSIIDAQGHILTNYHVVEGARDITVSLHDGSEYAGGLVGFDAETDIAVLRIDAPADKLEPLAWGDSTNLRVGQRIYAIGNPFGLERTMSTGIISSLNRQIPAGQHRTMRSLIQLDIALNQGNSGGPLISSRGELIGMNTAIMSTNGDSAGVGFAIPVSTIRRIVPQLISRGRVVRPTIGITRVYENDGGVLIVSVAPGGPAEKAGLRGFKLKTKTLRQGPFRYEQSVVDPDSADLITAANGKSVRTADELLEII